MKWIIICMVVCFFSCERGNDRAAMNMEIAEIKDVEIADSTVFQMDKEEGDKKGEQQGDKQKQQPVSSVIKTEWDKKIIKNATIKVEVADHKVFAKSISEKVKSLGGYIATEHQSHSEDQLQTTITVKVPVPQFESSVAALSSDVSKVAEKNITSDDVTAEHVDGRSRLEAKKAVRLRYLELLKSAKNMEDILAVQSEINSIQEEIETVTGRVNYLSQSAAMSTIHFTFYQVLNPTAADDSNSFGTELKEALAGGWWWMGKALIVLCTLWPLWLGIGLTYVIFKRRISLKFK